LVVNIDSSRLTHLRPASAAHSHHSAAQSHRRQSASQCLTIGLVNNMAGAAFKTTERQFVSLLDSASQDIPIRVSFYTLPGLSLAESGGSHFARHYQGVQALLDTRLDGLIVTGREPKMADLRDEPYWGSFTQVLDWARTNTYSSIWSCLAAHAAVLHMDGIGRRKNADKHFGVFECAHDSGHPLTHGLPAVFHIPHSRWNGIGQDDLAACGYSVLSRIADDGVDTFIKQEESLLVFFQGHPEYEFDTLMREYRRDVGRYVKGETGTYPLPPRNYFDRMTEDALITLGNEAPSRRSTEWLRRMAGAMENANIENKWRSSAARIYGNWLQCIIARMSESTGSQHADAVLSVSL
jgi:homoserine O-succinyltransferase